VTRREKHKKLPVDGLTCVLDQWWGANRVMGAGRVLRAACTLEQWFGLLLGSTKLVEAVSHVPCRSRMKLSASRGTKNTCNTCVHRCVGPLLTVDCIGCRRLSHVLLG
jgi:hypothetical protein